MEILFRHHNHLFSLSLKEIIESLIWLKDKGFVPHISEQWIKQVVCAVEPSRHQPYIYSPWYAHIYPVQHITFQCDYCDENFAFLIQKKYFDLTSASPKKAISHFTFPITLFLDTLKKLEIGGQIPTLPISFWLRLAGRYADFDYWYQH
ncbi:hypothetical protein ACU6T4_08825 [Avibacterium paragallinarum]|uniref:hypothetical protein n=1 Tax=Avibacterium TaxID=292486 RepID=UPI003BF87DD2